MVAFIGIGCTFVAQVVLARTMTVTQYGNFMYVLSWLTLLTLVANLGLETAVQRYLSVYQSTEEWPLFNGLLRFSNAVGFTVSLVIGASVILITWLLRSRLGPSLSWTFWIGASLLFLSTLCILRQMTMRALRHVVLGQMPDQIIRPVALGLFALCLYLFRGEKLESPMAIGLYYSATGVAFVVGSIWLHRIVAAKMPSTQPNYHISEWLHTAIYLALITALNQVLYRTDILMIGAIIGTKQVASYAVAVRLANFVFIGVTASNAICGPMIAEHYAKGDLDRLRAIVRLGILSILMISVPIAIGLVLLTKIALSVFGSAYTVGYTALVILVAGQLTKALLGPTGPLLNLTGHQRSSAWFTGSAVVLNIILNSFMIPIWHIQGAALASTISIMLLSSAMARRVSVYVKVNCTVASLLQRKRS